MQQKTNEKLPEYAQEMIQKLITETYGKKIKDINYQARSIPSGKSVPLMRRFSYDVFADIVMNEHNKHKKIINDMFNIDIEKYLKGFKIADKVIASNAFGTLYFVYPPSDFISRSTNRFNRRYILKIQSEPNSSGKSALDYESHMQKLFHKAKIAPKIISEFHLNDKNKTGIIIMEKLDDDTLPTLLGSEELSKEQLDQVFGWFIYLFKVMCDNDLIHADFHTGNIGIVFDERYPPLGLRPVLIDFGWSSSGPCDTRLEVLQLLRSLEIDIGEKSIKRNNGTYLENKLIDYYKKQFGDNIRKSYSGKNGYNELYSYYQDIYAKNIYYPDRQKYNDMANKRK